MLRVFDRSERKALNRLKQTGKIIFGKKTSGLGSDDAKFLTKHQ